MFLDIDNSLSTRQFATGAQVVVVGADLRRGPIGDNGGVAFCTLWVVSAGDIEVETADGDTVTILSVEAGTHLPIQVKRVVSMEMGAGEVIALY